MYAYRYIDQKQYYFMHINLQYKRKYRKKSVKYCILQVDAQRQSLKKTQTSGRVRVYYSPGNKNLNCNHAYFVEFNLSEEYFTFYNVFCEILTGNFCDKSNF